MSKRIATKMQGNILRKKRKGGHQTTRWVFQPSSGEDELQEIKIVKAKQNRKQSKLKIHYKINKRV